MSDTTPPTPATEPSEPQSEAPELDEPEPNEDDLLDDDLDAATPSALPEPPHPINWNMLSADDAEQEWLALSEWVNWLRREYGLPASVIPPAWHRHPELVWELSALHLHWLGAYDPEQDGSAPLGWHRDFAEARDRLREWVAASGTRLDRDRPTRVTDWPGEEPTAPSAETVIEDRADDFVTFVMADVARRRDRENAWRGAVEDSGRRDG